MEGRTRRSIPLSPGWRVKCIQICIRILYPDEFTRLKRRLMMKEAAPGHPPSRVNGARAVRGSGWQPVRLRERSCPSFQTLKF